MRTLVIAMLAVVFAAAMAQSVVDSQLHALQKQLNSVSQMKKGKGGGGGGGSSGYGKWTAEDDTESEETAAPAPAAKVAAASPEEAKFDAIQHSLARVDPIELKLGRIQDKVTVYLEGMEDKILEIRAKLNASTGIVGASTTWGKVQAAASVSGQQAPVGAADDVPRPYHKVPLEAALGKLQDRLEHSAIQVSDLLMLVRQDLNATFEAEHKFEEATLMDSKMLDGM